ncbi:MAG: isocitrate lyase, partial [Bacillota bacterium]
MEVEERIRREAEELERQWREDPRWQGIRRDYTAEDVVRLRGSVRVEYTLAQQGAPEAHYVLS